MEEDAVLNETPLIKSDWLSSHLSSKNSVYLKLDSLQPSGSNAIRGISSFMKQKYLNDKRIDTFVTSSINNTGIATAYMAMKLNCRCLIILPESMKKELNNNNDKNERQQLLIKKLEDEYGAEIKYHDNISNNNDDDHESDKYVADEYAQKLGAHEHGNYCYVPSELVHDPLIFDGYTNIIREIQDDDEFIGIKPDCILISCDNGSLLGGILGGLYQCGWSRSCKIIAAQSENNALFEATVNNSYKPYPVKSITCQGQDMGHRVLSSQIARFANKFEYFNPIKSIIVRDLDVLNMATLFAEKEHLLIDSQSAIAITALYKNKHYFKQFEHIVIVVNSGNNSYYNTKLLYKSLKNGKFNHKQTKFDIINTSNINQQIKQKQKELLSIDDDEKKDEEEEQEHDDLFEFDLDEIDSYDSQTEEM